jgi:hypothetical protein
VLVFLLVSFLLALLPITYVLFTQFMVLIPPSVEQCVFSCWCGASYTLTKSNLYLDADTSKTAQFKLVIFYIPSLVSLFRRLGRLSKKIHPGPNLFRTLHNTLIFYIEVLLAPSPIPKLEDHHLSFVRDCIFSTFPASLHPQPGDTPCCGDKGTHLTCHVHPFHALSRQQSQKVTVQIQVYCLILPLKVISFHLSNL